MAQHQYVLELPVLTGPVQLGQLGGGRQGGLHGVAVGAAVDGAVGHRHLPGGGDVQGGVQLQPGGQGRLLGGELALLVVDGRDAGLPVGEPLGGLGGLLPDRLVKELFLRDHGPGLKQPALGRGVVVEQVQRGAQAVGPGLGVGQRRVVHPGEGGPVRIGTLLVGLPDLHAAQVLELPQQLLPVRVHGEEPQVFHFDYGHESPTTLLIMSAAASSSRPAAAWRRASQAFWVSCSTACASVAAAASASARAFAA